MILRDYQLQAIEGLRDKIRRGKRRLLLVSPTGSGKTVIASEMVRGAVSKGNTVLFLAHRRELVMQAVARLADNGINAGVIMAGQPVTNAQVQVASVQTLARRVLPQANLIIIDEAHHAAARGYRKIIDACPDAFVIGLTATPFRLDGSGLGDLFDDAVSVATIEYLTALGHLVPAVYYAPNTINVKSLKKRCGDYDLTGFQTGLIGNPISSYKRYGEGGRAIAFCVNVEHAKQLAGQFNAEGMPAGCLDANTATADRDKILNNFKNGTLKIITNCGILGEGYDCPSASVVILARPTASLGLYMQQVGRVLRPHESKQEAIVIDHASNVLRFGMVEDINIQADLTNGIKKQLKQAVAAIRTCKYCFAVVRPHCAICPACGAGFPPPEVPKYKDGELVAYGGKRKAATKNATPEGFLKIMHHWARKNGRPAKAVYAAFLGKFNRWPSREERAIYEGFGSKD